MPRVGDQVFKIRSNELKRYTERLAQAPADARLRPLRAISVHCSILELDGTLKIQVEARLGSRRLAEVQLSLPLLQAIFTNCSISLVTRVLKPK
jgi:hypothetical protein